MRGSIRRSNWLQRRLGLQAINLSEERTNIGQMRAVEIIHVKLRSAEVFFWLLLCTIARSKDPHSAAAC